MKKITNNCIQYKNVEFCGEIPDNYKDYVSNSKCKLKISRGELCVEDLLNKVCIGKGYLSIVLTHSKLDDCFFSEIKRLVDHPRKIINLINNIKSIISKDDNITTVYLFISPNLVNINIVMLRNITINYQRHETEKEIYYSISIHNIDKMNTDLDKLLSINKKYDNVSVNWVQRKNRIKYVDIILRDTENNNTVLWVSQRDIGLNKCKEVINEVMNLSVLHNLINEVSNI